MTYLADLKPVRVQTLKKMKQVGEKITCLTAYDASFASLVDSCGIDTILIGDSLGMVIQGEKTTLPVSQCDMVYHTKCVVKGASRALIIADMSFGTYGTPIEAYHHAVELMQAGAQMVKLEGGAFLAETINFLVERGIPVCAHIGLTPQSVNMIGGYRVQGKEDKAGEELMQDALALEKAGASLIVLEMVPATLAKRITESLHNIATIGIGAGIDCDGQVLVLYDIIGVYPGKKPRFGKNFLSETGSLEGAVKAFISEVKAKTYPALEHSY